jgi:glycosyltransferase involved in cell wall biosynthesis
MDNAQNRTRAKICHLTSGHRALDSRIFHKEAKTLSEKGYRVTLIAQHDQAEVRDGVKIVPLPTPRGRFQRMILGPFRIARLAVREGADLYHFHDPDLVFTGLLLKLLGKRVVYDVHEDYPKQVLSKEWIRPGILRVLVAKLFNLVEKGSARAYDSIVAATPDISRNFPAYKTTVVRNFPILSLMDQADGFEKKTDGKPVVIYAGGLSRVRGTKELIASMGFLDGAVKLHLLGPWMSESFKDECQATAGYEHVEYMGSVPLAEVYRHLRMADVGVAVLYPIKNYLTSLPIKAYEYMYSGLPMIMSNFPMWMDMFAQCAVFADPYDPEDIADNIRYLLENPEEAGTIAANGTAMTQDECNWEKESENLTDLYEAVLNRG